MTREQALGCLQALLSDYRVTISDDDLTQWLTNGLADVPFAEGPALMKRVPRPGNGQPPQPKHLRQLLEQDRAVREAERREAEAEEENSPRSTKTTAQTNLRELRNKLQEAS